MGRFSFVFLRWKYRKKGSTRLGGRAHDGRQRAAAGGRGRQVERVGAGALAHRRVADQLRPRRGAERRRRSAAPVAAARRRAPARALNRNQ